MNNKKKNMRFTRSSYKRKLIVFGVSIFMSLALSATGFAAWVISKDTQKEANGGIEIGAVTEASISITDIEFIADPTKDPAEEEIQNFVFEPLADDTNGRVRFDGESKPENLDVMFTWKVGNYQTVGDVYVDFKLPATVYQAVENNWIALPNSPALTVLSDNETIDGKSYKVVRYTIQTAQNKITADGSTTDGILTYDVSADGTEVTFTMELAFSWGTVFGGINPGIYYDTTGADVSYEELKAELNEFKATLHGITYNAEFEALSEADKKAQYDAKPIDTYYIVINAKVA